MARAVLPQAPDGCLPEQCLTTRVTSSSGCCTGAATASVAAAARSAAAVPLLLPMVLLFLRLLPLPLPMLLVPLVLKLLLPLLLQLQRLLQSLLSLLLLQMLLFLLWLLLLLWQLLQQQLLPLGLPRLLLQPARSHQHSSWMHPSPPSLSPLGSCRTFHNLADIHLRPISCPPTACSRTLATSAAASPVAPVLAPFHCARIHPFAPPPPRCACPR
jgi:hypothetical protein